MSTLFPPPLPDFPTTLPPPAPPYKHRHHHASTVIHSVLAGVLVFILFIISAIAYRKLSRKRTVPADLKSPPPQPQKQVQQYSYNVLRRATSSFAASNRLGQGGFGSVYKGVLPSGLEIAVKVMSGSGSLQGEREFHNELSLATRISDACGPRANVISVLGFCSDQNRRRKRKMLLVYEYMQNGSLQDALLCRKCVELMDWNVRFMILLDVAKGVEFLHFSCDPPIVHCDIKPSNVLLDCNFNAKIADFGLAKVLGMDENDVIESFIECGEEEEGDLETDNNNNDNDVERKSENFGDCREENRSEETESVVTGEVVVNMDVVSPESCCVTVVDADASPSEYLERASFSDQISVESSNRRFLGRKKSVGGSGRDWWWKQDTCSGDSGRVKDYVMEWIGSEIKKERPKKNWLTTTEPVSSELEPEDSNVNAQPKKVKKKLETEKKNRKPREWWKEEFCDELVKKKKKKRRGSNTGEMWWQRDEEFVPQKKKSKSSSKGSIDWWIDGLSGEFRHRRRNSQECPPSGEIPKSGGISSTPSMRGTVCYIAPEKCDGGILSEKSDVYSYGVLLLVLVSGRRPLQVTASPMSEFERANLISWARQLARNGKLLDLVDPKIHSLDQKQAMLCITTALLCLQRSPAKRPTMREIVGMLSGEAEPPHLPFEFSPSPPTNIPFKSRRKPRYMMARIARERDGTMFLDELHEGSSGPIIVMVCRRWDVTSVNGRYMSTDYIVTDKNGNVMQCVARNNIAHYFFDKLKEGGLYSIRGFTVQPLNEYRVLKDNPFIISLNGTTVVRKVDGEVAAFERYPFQFAEFEDLQPTGNQYFVDVIGYVMEVGEQSVKSSGARTLEFSLSNERKRQVRVTLWGSLGDAMIKNKQKNPAVYPLILTSMSAKYYNSTLCLSSSSSTMLIDSDDVPALKTFKSSISCVRVGDTSEPITETPAVLGSLRELIDWARESTNKNQSAVFRNAVEIASIRTKNSWFLFSCTGGKCRKGITRADGYFKCKGCNSRVDYPKIRFRIQADVFDGTASIVVVLFDETAERLVNRTAKSLVEEQQQDNSPDAPLLPAALDALIGTSHTFEIRSHSYYRFGDYESFNCAKIVVPGSDNTDVAMVTDNKVLTISNNESSSSSGVKRVPPATNPEKQPGRKLRKVIIQESDSEDYNANVDNSYTATKNRLDEDFMVVDDGVEGNKKTHDEENAGMNE